MSHHRLLSRLYNTPLAISQAKLDVITSQVTLRLIAGDTVPSLEGSEGRAHGLSIVGQDKQSSQKPTTAVIKVFDSLVAKNGAGDSGITSYESIQKDINAAVAAGVDTIVFYIDSPGGEVAGCFGLAKTINSLSDMGINTIAVSDGMITSAAYVIASACDKIMATSSTIVGSIGVIMTLINATAADKKAGLSYKIIRSKDGKALLNPHEPFTDKGLEDAVKMLDELDVIMNETVTSFRPSLTTDKIITLNGNTVLGEEALQLGLIDEVVDSYSSVIDGLSSPSASGKSPRVSTTKPNGANMSLTLEEALAENIRLSSELEATNGKVALAAAKGKADEQARILGVIEAASTFKLDMSIAVKRIKAGTSVEDSIEMFESIKEAVQMANPIGSVVGATASVHESINGSANMSEIDTLIAKVDQLGKQPEAQDDFSASLNLLNMLK